MGTCGMTNGLVGFGGASGEGSSGESTGERRGLPDVQASPDDRRVAIDRVGVKDVRAPLLIAGGAGSGAGGGGGGQPVQATVDMYVALPHDRKGTHMSRFVSLLNERRGVALDQAAVSELTREMRERLGATTAELRARFTYFIEKAAPVTGEVGLMDYEVELRCTSESRGCGASQEDVTDFVMTVAAPATSLCPCSKEISAYGAHNQRCRISASVRTDVASDPMSIEDLVTVLEGAASQPVWSVLKRPDEQYVTEKAFENPKFVEDIVRDLAGALNREERVVWYSIDSENFESIHSHNAYAAIERDKR